MDRLRHKFILFYVFFRIFFIYQSNRVFSSLLYYIFQIVKFINNSVQCGFFLGIMKHTKAFAIAFDKTCNILLRSFDRFRSDSIILLQR